jgi:hypothetical protein
MLFLRQLYPNADGTCTDFNVREEKSNGRSVGRIYQAAEMQGHWFWCLNDRAPSPAADRGYAPTRAKAMLMLKQRWLQRGPLKSGELQMGRPKWMESHPDYKHISR